MGAGPSPLSSGCRLLVPLASCRLTDGSDNSDVFTNPASDHPKGDRAVLSVPDAPAADQHMIQKMSSFRSFHPDPVPEILNVTIWKSVTHSKDFKDEF